MPAKRSRCRGATAGVAMPGGSSGSRGPPAWGARKATERKKGCLAGRVARDQVHRSLGVVVGAVEDRVAADAVRPEQPVLVQRVAPEAVGRGVDRAVPLVPARRHVGGRRVAPVAVQELADVERAIPGALEPEREVVARVELAVAADGRPVAEHAVVVGVLAGEEGGARRAAERERHEAAREGGAAARRSGRARSASPAATRASGRRSSGPGRWDAAGLGRPRCPRAPGARAPRVWRGPPLRGRPGGCARAWRPSKHDGAAESFGGSPRARCGPRRGTWAPRPRPGRGSPGTAGRSARTARPPWRGGDTPGRPIRSDAAAAPSTGVCTSPAPSRGSRRSPSGRWGEGSRSRPAGPEAWYPPPSSVATPPLGRRTTGSANIAAGVSEKSA